MMSDTSEMSLDELTKLFGGSVPGEALKIFMGPGTATQKRQSLRLIADVYKDPRIAAGIILAKQVFSEMASNGTVTFDELVPDPERHRDHLIFWMLLFRKVCAAPEFNQPQAQQGEPNVKAT